MYIGKAQIQEGDLYPDETAKAGWYTYKGNAPPMDVVADITVHEVAPTNLNEGTIYILDSTDLMDTIM